MKHIALLMGCLLVMPAGTYAGELYRWVDKSGTVHYGDAPATEGAQVERKKFYSPATQDGDDLPYETRRAQQNFPVTLYVADNCIEACNQARSFLNKRGIPFSEVKLVTKEEIDAFKALSGSDQAPTLAVGRNYLKGFLAVDWDSELDIAEYPKTLLYRPPQAPVKPLADKPVTEK